MKGIVVMPRRISSQKLREVINGLESKRTVNYVCSLKGLSGFSVENALDGDGAEGRESSLRRPATMPSRRGEGLP